MNQQELEDKVREMCCLFREHTQIIDALIETIKHMEKEISELKYNQRQITNNHASNNRPTRL